MTIHDLVETAAVVSLTAPALLLTVLGITSMVSRPIGEVATARLTRFAMLVTFGAAASGFVTLLVTGAPEWVAPVKPWFGLGVGTFDLRISWLSLGFATLAAAMSGVDAAFSRRYMHQESGYNRYFVLFAMFVVGIMLVALAGTIDLLFAGWELLGLSSALLVGFFHERVGPVKNALRVFAVYRVSDAAMLCAAVLVHHWAGSGSLALIFSGGTSASATLSYVQSEVIAVLLLTAVVGKSGLLPLSGWLPRAMEGPTSSSAIFYGSLSIHAGCYLLLRAEPLLAHAPVARVLAIGAGVATALHATACARAQTDVKSVLTYATLTQVGLIVTEIGIGWTTIAFIHLVGNACYRMLQFLSAPNILHDLHHLENALDEHARPEQSPAPKRWLYLTSIERGFVDALIDRAVVAPFVAAARRLDRLDRGLCGVLPARGQRDLGESHASPASRSSRPGMPPRDRVSVAGEEGTYDA